MECIYQSCERASWRKTLQNWSVVLVDAKYPVIQDQFLPQAEHRQILNPGLEVGRIPGTLDLLIHVKGSKTLVLMGGRLFPLGVIKMFPLHRTLRQPCGTPLAPGPAGYKENELL